MRAHLNNSFNLIHLIQLITGRDHLRAYRDLSNRHKQVNFYFIGTLNPAQCTEGLVGRRLQKLNKKKLLKRELLFFLTKICRRSTQSNPLNDSVILSDLAIRLKTKTNSYIRLEYMLLLMASTVSFHSDSFIARIDVILPFVVEKLIT